MKFNILKSVEPEKTAGELICKRVTTPCYITNEHTVGDVAEVFTGNSSLHVLGVTDPECRALGIIMKNELFSLIGRMYGRELYLNKSIRDFIMPAETIYYKRNTFSVIAELAAEIRSVNNSFYILTDTENRFRGLVSTFDLVLFLSDMMTSELRAARRVHSAIVKDEIIIDTGKISVNGSMIMAGESGGDFHHVREIGEKRWFISLCDVSGKGLNAGLISVAVSSMYAVYDFRNGIDELIRRINSYIYDLFEGEIFLTGVFIELDELTGRLDLYDMGHSMVYMVREEQILSFPEPENNIPLGIRKEAAPLKSRIILGSGDTILTYTDGLPEQGNLANKRFGEQRILSLIAKYRNSSPGQIKKILFEELKSWSLGNAQGDDMSLLMIRYR